MALTAKQERFVAEYLIDLNATQAVITEGPFAGSIVDVRKIKGGTAWFEMLTGIKGSARVETMQRHVRDKTNG